MGVQACKASIPQHFTGGTSGKESACQRKRGKRCRFNPWVGNIPEEETAAHSSIFTWRIPWTESLEGCSPWGRKESDTTERTHPQTQQTEVYRVHPKRLLQELTFPSSRHILPEPHWVNQMSFLLQNHSANQGAQLKLPREVQSGGEKLVGAKALEIQCQSLQWTLRVDFLLEWLVDLLADQGTLKNLLQHHGSETSILPHSAFFMVQLSHPHTTTGKAIALTVRTFVSKAMAAVFNTLSRLLIAFNSRSNRLLMSWLQSLSAVILEPKKIKAATSSTFSPSACHELMGKSSSGG